MEWVLLGSICCNLVLFFLYVKTKKKYKSIDDYSLNHFMYDVLKVGLEEKSVDRVASQISESVEKYCGVDFVSIFYIDRGKYRLLSTNVDMKYSKKLEKVIQELASDGKNKVFIAEEGALLTYATARDRGILFSSVVVLTYNNEVIGCLLLEHTKKDDFGLEARLKLYTKVFEGVSFVLNNVFTLEKLYRLSSKDQLTGVYNRRFIDNELNKQKDKDGYSLVLFDIDFFKKFNDTYGHSFGDLVLKKVAEKVDSLVDNGWVARYGGEEFMIYIKSDDKKEVYNLIESIRKSLEELEFDYNGDKVSVTSSFGVALKEIKDDVETTIEKADIALYHSKRNGRNMVTIYEQGMSINDNNGIMVI